MQTDFVNLVPESSQNTAEWNNTLGQNEFLQLLIAQMQNQDPLEPIRNEDFIAQLAQFSSLEQLIDVNNGLISLALLESSINNSQAVNLIGKKITVPGNSLLLEEGQATCGRFYLGEAAESVTVQIRDSAGELVRTIELGTKGVGDHEFSYDGRDDSGAELPDGKYTFSITAVGENGQEISVTTYVDVLVEGITFSNGYVYVIAGGQKYMLSEITEVRGV